MEHVPEAVHGVGLEVEDLKIHEGKGQPR